MPHAFVCHGQDKRTVTYVRALSFSSSVAQVTTQSYFVVFQSTYCKKKKKNINSNWQLLQIMATNPSNWSSLSNQWRRRRRAGASTPFTWFGHTRCRSYSNANVAQLWPKNSDIIEFRRVLLLFSGQTIDCWSDRHLSYEYVNKNTGHGDVRALFIVRSSIRMPAVAFDILMSQLPQHVQVPV